MKKKKADENDSDDEFVEGLEKKAMTIDDILADSDSDSLSDNERNTKSKKS